MEDVYLIHTFDTINNPKDKSVYKTKRDEKIQHNIVHYSHENYLLFQFYTKIIKCMKGNS
jgi:hypothetical protein